MKVKFKQFKPILLALLFFFFIEIFNYLRIGKKNIINASIENSFFDNKFKRFDVGQKYMILYKSQIFKENNADFIQIGDSSGFFGIQPNIVNSYLNGLNYINLSCCADSGWDGYVYTANYFLKNNPNVSNLVLYITPYSLPLQFGKGFSGDLHKIFGDIEDKNLFAFLNYIPSLYYRKKILNYTYQNNIEEKDKEYKRVMKNLGVAKNFESITGYKTGELINYLKYSKGWLPYDRKKNFDNMPTKECGSSILKNFYDASGKPSLYKSLKKVKEISDRYNTRLIIIFNPVACSDSAKMSPINEDLKKFKTLNPDVYIPFEFINTINKENFSDQWHLTPKASIKNSQKIGEVLSNFLYVNLDN